MRPPPACAPRRQRGAALLVAMVLLAVVATLSAGMVWQQWRAVQVEGAERARAQSGLVLSGALDWARLMLRENARLTDGHLKLHELLDQPLAEVRLSTLLAADRNNSADADVDAFVNGTMSDAQARYNLRNLFVGNQVAKPQLAILERLCGHAGVSVGTASEIARQLLLSQQPADPQAPLAPQQFSDLVWLGIDEPTLTRLRPFVVLLPGRTPININTASREVLSAVIPALDLGSADRLVRLRPFKDIDSMRTAMNLTATIDPQDADVRSSFFEVQGRIRLGERALEEVTLVERRNGQQVVAIQRLRRAALGTATGGNTR